MEYKGLKDTKIKPVQILAIGFFIAILVGSALLLLPISSQSGESTGFVDALFTSTSAVCVTGLVTVNTAEHWSYFGKTVIILLIQLGGLGFMSFTVLYALILRKRISYSRRILLQEALSIGKISGIVKLVKYLLGFTFTVELIGALFLMTQFIPRVGIAKGIYFGIFHSISAFCNAGFDLFGDSMIGYDSNTVVIITISLLIIIGGLGFAIWLEIFSLKKTRKLSLNAKLVIIVSVVLIIGGTILMFLFEYDNEQTMKGMSLYDKILNSFFASVSPRTAGFNSISLQGMTRAGIFLTIILMLIGGSPGSTAGGIKTTTIAVLYLTVVSMFKGRQDTEFNKRRINKNDVYKAFTVFFIAGTVIIIATFILSITDGHHVVNGTIVTIEDLVYEVVSAFATVGLTLGMTAKLSIPGKILLAIIMYMGRVGSLTLIYALMRKGKISSGIKYPEEKIIIG